MIVDDEDAYYLDRFICQQNTDGFKSHFPYFGKKMIKERKLTRHLCRKVTEVKFGAK